MVKPAMLCGPSSSGHEEDTRTHQLRISNSTSQNQHTDTSETQVKHTPHRTMHLACRMASSSFMLLSFFWTQHCSKELKVGLLKAFVLHTFTMYFLAWPAITLLKLRLSGSPPGSTRAALAAAALVFRWPF